MNELLINILKSARTDKGLKQQEVADRLGIKANTISNWEKGRTEPDIDSFVELCDIYQIDCAELLKEAYDFTKVKKHVSMLEYDILKKYRNLDPHGQELVDTILDKEYSRCKSSASITKFPVTGLNAAHERTDIPESSKTDEAKKIEEDIMDDENF